MIKYTQLENEKKYFIKSGRMISLSTYDDKSRTFD